MTTPLLSSDNSNNWSNSTSSKSIDIKILVIGGHKSGKKTLVNYNDSKILAWKGKYQTGNIYISTLFPEYNNNFDNNYITIHSTIKDISYKLGDSTWNLNSYPIRSRVESQFIHKLDAIIFMYSSYDLNMDMKLNDDNKGEFEYEYEYEFNDYIEWYNSNYSMFKSPKNGNISPQIIFINNKIDLYNYKSNGYYDKKCKDMCDEYGFKYYEVSLLDNNNICREIYYNIGKQYFQEHYPITLINGNKISSNNNFCINFGNIFYDILTIFISFADLGTDLWMLYQYYSKDRIAFFIIGLIIIIIAQFAYCALFIDEFSHYGWRPPQKACLFIMILPFSWCLGVIFYMSAEYEWFNQSIMKGIFGLRVEKKPNYEDTSEAWKWVRKKFDKHIGFILESICEAFPS